MAAFDPGARLALVEQRFGARVAREGGDFSTATCGERGDVAVRSRERPAGVIARDLAAASTASTSAGSFSG
jgi:hypothetical protein